MSMADRRAGAGHKLDRAYQRYRLPKRSGGSRVISVPHHHLKRVQRAILDRLIQPLGAHESAFGFVPGRSIGENAALHVGQAIVANVDVSNCFPSVKWPLVLGVLRRDLGDRLGPGAISLLVDICTADGGLPIGAPTSPALLNRVLLRSDETLHSAATKLNCRYSRYADDLTFSGDHGAVKLLGIAKRTLSQIGLELDPKKTNIYRPGRRQIVTGLVVNERVSVPRRIRRRIRAAVHAVEQGRAPVWHDKPEDVTSLRGRLSFVNAINPTQATPLIARLKSASTSERSDDGA
jgi:retron-type reverse transcriptase